MIKYIILFFMVVSSFAKDMQIYAGYFSYNDKTHVSKFTKDVNVTKGEDNILANVVYVYLNQDKKLYKLVAIGNVRFHIKDKKNNTYVGNSDRLLYTAPTERYTLEGHVHVTKVEVQQELYGKKVIIDKIHGLANVIGGENAPLKFIIKVKD